MKNRGEFSQSEKLHLIVRLLIMIKAEDILIFAIDDFYLNMVLDLYYVNRCDTPYGLEISQDGENYVKRYTDTILPGTN